MTVVRLSITPDERRAAELRDAVETLEGSELSLSSVATLCKRVIDVADRLDPPLRVVRDEALLYDVERAAPGAHRLKVALHSLTEVADRG